MEEEKAAAYYEELVRKGGNAAKYKQGLGFEGSQSSSLPKSIQGYGSLSNFVKSSPGRTAALEKESRVVGIRDKLRKKDDDGSLRKPSPDRNRKTDRVDDKDARRRRRRSRTPESPRRDRKREKSPRHRSSSPGERDPKSNKQKRSRSRSSSRRSDSSKKKARAETPEKNATSERRQLSPSRSPSPSSSSEKSRRKKDSKQNTKDRSIPPEDDSRHKRSPDRSRTRRSRSRSAERRRRRSRSRSRSNERRSRRRSRSYSPRRSRRRDRSRSPPSYRSSYRKRHDRYDQRVSKRSSSYRSDGNRRRYEDDRERDGSSYRARNRKAEERSRAAPEKTQERDYSKLIPNFDSMTPAEKVKAKMKLQLAETVVKDKSKGMSGEWERFDFDKSAPLDDDAKQDYFGDGTGAGDDTTFLKNTGSTFVASTNQVTREAQRQSAHEDAIFGPPQGLRITVSRPDVLAEVEKSDRAVDSEDQPVIVEDTTLSHKDETPGESLFPKTGSNMVVSEQVIAMQQAGSWQERARRMRESRAALGS
ncbi:hypothetical protein R1sor_010738 [Riccia sorocarpa]|uniref:Uncharacterized protein n=1 Tax=Riccia sorocarpa TaxID=122646 RepID=A0ABD3HYW8_9MARC